MLLLWLVFVLPVSAIASASAVASARASATRYVQYDRGKLFFSKTRMYAAPYVGTVPATPNIYIYIQYVHKYQTSFWSPSRSR